MEGQLSEIDSQIAQLEQNLRNSDKTCKELKDQNYNLNDKLAEKTAEAARLSTELVTIKTSLDETNKKYEFFFAQKESQEKLDENAYMTEMKNIESAWQDVVNSKQKEINALTSDNVKLHGLVNEM